MSTPKAQITRGGAQRRRENSRGGQSAPYSQNAGQVDVRRQEQQDSGQADADQPGATAGGGSTGSLASTGAAVAAPAAIGLAALAAGVILLARRRRTRQAD